MHDSYSDGEEDSFTDEEESYDDEEGFDDEVEEYFDDYMDGEEDHESIREYLLDENRMDAFIASARQTIKNSQHTHVLKGCVEDLMEVYRRESEHPSVLLVLADVLARISTCFEPEIVFVFFPLLQFLVEKSKSLEQHWVQDTVQKVLDVLPFIPFNSHARIEALQILSAASAKYTITSNEEVDAVMKDSLQHLLQEANAKNQTALFNAISQYFLNKKHLSAEESAIFVRLSESNSFVPNSRLAHLLLKCNLPSNLSKEIAKKWIEQHDAIHESTALCRHETAIDAETAQMLMVYVRDHPLIKPSMIRDVLDVVLPHTHSLSMNDLHLKMFKAGLRRRNLLFSDSESEQGDQNLLTSMLEFNLEEADLRWALFALLPKELFDNEEPSRNETRFKRLLQDIIALGGKQSSLWTFASASTNNKQPTFDILMPSINYLAGPQERLPVLSAHGGMTGEAASVLSMFQMNSFAGIGGPNNNLEASRDRLQGLVPALKNDANNDSKVSTDKHILLELKTDVIHVGPMESILEAFISAKGTDQLNSLKSYRLLISPHVPVSVKRKDNLRSIDAKLLLDVLELFAKRNLVDATLSKLFSSNLGFPLIPVDDCLLFKIASICPSVLSFSTRVNWLRMRLFGVPRSLNILLSNKNRMASGPLSKFLKEVVMPMPRIRVTLERSQMASPKYLCALLQSMPRDATLEVRWQDEPGTGSGPTAEFYDLLSRACDPMAVFAGFADKDEKALLGVALERVLLDGQRLPMTTLNQAFFVALHEALFKPNSKQGCTKWLPLVDNALNASIGEGLLGLPYALPPSYGPRFHLQHSFNSITSDNLKAFREDLEAALTPDVDYILQSTLIKSIICRNTLGSAIFSPDELRSLFCGFALDQNNAHFTAKDILKCIQPAHGYTHDSPQVQWLAKWLAEQSNEPSALGKLLRWLTGSSTFPSSITNNVKSFECPWALLDPPLTVVPRSSTSSPALPSANNYKSFVSPALSSASVQSVELPTVMTCTNYLKLPMYASEGQLRSAMDYAVQEGTDAFLLS